MATKTRQLADFLVAGGVSDAEIQSVPHIRPGILQPAVAGKDLSGTALGGSYVYGTAHTDGHSYYYTDIKGSKPIKDPRIGGHFGSQRHKTTSVQLLEQETATHGENVYSVDGREWMRYVAPNLESFNNEHGTWFQIGSVTTGTNWLEITGYFNAVNWSALLNSSTSDVNLAIDGTANSSVFTGGSNSVLTPLGSRYVDASSLISLIFDSTPTLGIHTVKISNVSGDYFRLWGIELIAQDTGSTARKQHVNIPAQNVVSYGKKFSVGSDTLTNAVHKHYNPFAFKTDGSTAWASGAHNGTSWPVGTGSSHNIDTATSLGLANWLHSSNYYKPYNGGRVVIWVANDGTIKTSVNMMPPNAQNLGGTAITAKANAAVANDTYLPTFSGAIDHSQSEIAKTFHIREFGNGGANQGAGGTYADASMLTVAGTSDDIAYVMDDGLSSFSGSGSNTLSGHTAGDGLGFYMDTNSKSMYLTFIGTGFTGHGIDNTSTATRSGSITNVAQNLPYGTHILKFTRGSYPASTIHVDGVQVYSGSTPYTAIREATFHQPKMPPIPQDAVIIADYMLMADFVKQTGTGSDIYGQISKGVRYISASRDHFYNSAGAFDSTNSGTGHSEGIGLRVRNANDASSAKLSFFGTTAGFIVEASDNAGYSVQLPAAIGSASAVEATETALDNTASNQYDILTIAETVDLGITKFNLTVPTGYNHYGSYVASPIHTSSHYQSIETPFLHELVGGDRNMEQINLVVTPDGKSWDEVTRDTSYIGKGCVQTGTDTGSTSGSTIQIFDEWRGLSVNKHWYNKDFAIAYDRLICLREGWYLIHSQTLRKANVAHAVIVINGTESMIAYGSNNDHDTPSNSLNVFLKRGDYIQNKGAWFQSLTYAHYQISRV